MPSHWLVQKLKYIAVVQLSNVDKKSVEGEVPIRLCNYVDVYKNDVIHSDMDFMEATATSRQVAAFSLKADDVLITKDSEEWDDIAVPAYVVSDLDGVLCGYHLAHVRPNPDVVCGSYLFRAFAAEGIADQFRVAANGITRYGIGKDEIVNSIFPVPSLDEQRAIASFLDRKTAEIDALIAKKQRMIDLLQEKRQALISEAVTKGLDPNVRMKDSGFPWLGSVPKHWEVERIKFRMLTIGQGWSPQCENTQAEQGEWGVLKVGCMNSGIYDESENKALPLDLAPIPELEVKVGDVLMSRSNTVELVGAVGIVDKTQGKILLCDKLYRICFNKDLLCPSYAVHLLRSRAARLQIERDASGASPSMKNISNEVVANLVFAFPPVAEQEQITGFINSSSALLFGLIQRIAVQLEKLYEYRQTLISAAVTGKIDLSKEKACWLRVSHQ